MHSQLVSGAERVYVAAPRQGSFPTWKAFPPALRRSVLSMTSSAASSEFYPSDFHGRRFGKAGDQVAAHAVHRVKQSKIKQFEN